MTIPLNLPFWKGRRVLLTGHTGFKGAWLSLLLENMGAKVFGVSLAPNTHPNLYEVLSPWTNLKSIFCDIRDRKKLADIVTAVNPEIVIHMAAQPLVRESYQSPVETIETNVMGTVNLLDSLQLVANVTAILIVTSDKVYANHSSNMNMTEDSPLGGHDPYSASKAAAEIVTYSYAQSFFLNRNVSVCSVRAGNVIGGGDWAKDRIIPDLWRAYSSGQTVELRYPEAVRPWQHVLDPLYGYLRYLECMVFAPQDLPRALNFGPPMETIRTVMEVAERFADSLKTQHLWTIKKTDAQLLESTFLSIDSSLAKLQLGWKSMLDVDSAIFWTCKWYKAFKDGQDMLQFSKGQIEDYVSLVNAASISGSVVERQRKYA